MAEYQVVNMPVTRDSRLNKALFDDGDPMFRNNVEHIELSHVFMGQVNTYIFTISAVRNLGTGMIAINLPGRTWADLQTGTKVKVRPFKFNPTSQYLSSVCVRAELTNKSPQSFDTKHMNAEFSKQFPGLALSVGQRICFYYPNPENNNKEIIFKLKVKELEALHFGEGTKKDTGDIATKKVQIGLTTANTITLFESDDGQSINFVGDLTSTAAPTQILNPNWDFESMGIGGLSEEFSSIFRRAFASRMLPASIAAKIGVKHVRGMLLYGPPGTGKTLIARQIGKLLSTREPKVVNGPEILNKYVGESEKNIRDLFAEAEEEQKKMGVNSGLHMIIFDEIDAICKARSATTSSGGANDTVVNQLLTKIDGVNALNNVLVIGMTNRRDLIDEALLRPGRMGVQMEIGLPNKAGRLEIFKIHTRQMMETGTISDDVNLEELAEESKNFSGAEIEGLVNAAQSYAINRAIKADGKVTVDMEKLNSIKISRKDFMAAIEKDIKPALGASEDKLRFFLKDPIIVWDEKIQRILDESNTYLLEALEHDPENGRKMNILIVGAPGCGQTTLAANLAMKTESPFIRMYDTADTVGMMESSKGQYLNKLFNDAYRSQLSCLLIDDIERIMEYTRIGPRFSSHILQSFTANLKRLPPVGRNLITICTCTNSQFLDDLDLNHFFDVILEVPAMTEAEQIYAVLTHLAEEGNMTFDDGQRDEIRQAMLEYSPRREIHIGVKNLIKLVSISARDEKYERVEKFLTRIERYVRSSFAHGL